MRSLVVVCLLAGCYKPATESCYYQCATQGTPCPSGLACVAGMCATPGETCSERIDSSGSESPIVDSPRVTDAPASACNNGTAAIGEICYGTPLTFTTPAFGTPADGVLGDYDGDGDLDLIYLQTGNNGSIRVHLQNTGVFGANTTGVTLVNPMFLRAFNVDASTMSIELIVATDTEVVTWGYNGTPYRVSTYPGTPLATSAVVTNVTNGPITDVVTLGSNLALFHYDASLTLALVGTTSTAASTQDLAAGRLNGDNFADVVTAGPSGIVRYNGGTAGLSNSSSQVVTTAVNGIDVGDINGGGINDLVYVINDGGVGQPGQIGVMLGMGDGTFATATSTPVANLGNAVAVRDLDGDGFQDVVGVRTGANRALVICRGRADGLLEAPVFVSLPGSSAQIVIRGDFNNDSVPDIVVTDRLTRTIYVFPSNP